MRNPISRLFVAKAGVLFGVWTAYGLLCTWQAHYWYGMGPKPMSWLDAFRYQMTYAWIWAAASPGVLQIASRFRFGRGKWRHHLPVHAAAILVIAPGTRIVFDAIAMPPISPFHAFTWAKLLQAMQADFDLGVLLYCLVVLVEHALLYYQRYQAGAVEASRLQTQLVQAQMQALRMQLHPHFLFNALHTVAALVHEDPEMAEITITRLGDLLRLFLRNSTIHEVPLSEELHTLDLYLEIEQARFEDRLQVRYEVPASLRGASVPNLILQPLVENSIRHGLSKRAEAGTVFIAAESYGECLVLRITDNGAGFAEDPSLRQPKGMGLEITRGRLQSLYGPHQSLVLTNRPGGGVEARLTLPLRMGAGAAEETENEHVEVQNTDRRR